LLPRCACAASPRFLGAARPLPFCPVTGFCLAHVTPIKADKNEEKNHDHCKSGVTDKRDCPTCRGVRKIHRCDPAPKMTGLLDFADASAWALSAAAPSGISVVQAKM
jgi:hypothetical protein